MGIPLNVFRVCVRMNVRDLKLLLQALRAGIDGMEQPLSGDYRFYFDLHLDFSGARMKPIPRLQSRSQSCYSVIYAVRGC